MHSCDRDLPFFPDTGCGNIQRPKSSYTIENGRCFQDGQLLGDVIFADEKIMQVEQKNGGLCDGRVITFIRTD